MIIGESNCECHACIVANVGRPSVTIPAWKDHQAEELHGVELRRWWEARDAYKATVRAIVGDPKLQTALESIGETPKP
jgi:hypothetical protein